VGKFEEDGEKFANAAQSHFGFVQREMLRTITAFSALPCEYSLWTSHETKGEEDNSRAAIRGPALVGTAATDAVKKYCSMLLHFDKGKVWFVEHPDAMVPKITYHAKTTVPAHKLAGLYKAYPDGCFVPTPEGGLDQFMETVEGL